MRSVTLAAIWRAITEAQVFVFIMGLTEGWENSVTGVAYAMCLGPLAGEFDPAQHAFVNDKHRRILADMRDVVRLARKMNPSLRLLLSVSPVPLTATASGDHVLVATMQSKSTLRLVAHELREDHRSVDYFPSYEVIASPTFRGMFYQPSQREVSSKGVEGVMSHFFAGLGIQQTAAGAKPAARAKPALVPLVASADDIQCEEAALQAFEK